ncbi:hypothetical protein [Streptomyces sp. NPDC003077]|uniref:hypothetical protein n=1 Tax=Streptomyces sp. NPDC003077 TaxID=3154443 RepID=UPI0033B5345D
MQNPYQGPESSFMEGEHLLPSHHGAGGLMHWLVSARKHVTKEQTRNAVTWVSDSLDIKQDHLLDTAGLIGHRDAPNVTLSEAVERSGGDPFSFALYVVMLCGDQVATICNPKWPKQFDLMA